MGKVAKKFKKRIAAKPKKEKQSEDIVFQLKSWQKKILEIFRKGESRVNQ